MFYAQSCRNALFISSAFEQSEPTKDTAHRFGKYLLDLRKSRRLTQEALAERCGLSSDTIRRLEAGKFSPTLHTLDKLAGGLSLTFAALFAGFESEVRSEINELFQFLIARSQGDQALALRMVRSLFVDQGGDEVAKPNVGSE